MAREQLKNLTEPMYYVLLSLIHANHGYGIMQMVERVTEGRVVIGAGTLYALLSRFDKENYITQVAEENRRKIYQLTDEGREILDDEFTRLNQMIDDGKKFFDYDQGEPMPPDDTDKGEKAKVIDEVVSIADDTDRQTSKEKSKEPATRCGFGRLLTV